MSSNPHRIRSQRLVVTARTPEDAFAIRDYLRREWESSLLPAMERAFNDADVPERTIRCSRVELTLRVASPEELAGGLPERIAEELSGRLRELMGRGEERDDGGSPDSRVVRQRLVGEDRFGIVLGYLRTGALAWSAAHAGADVIGELRQICRLEFSRLAGLLRDGMIPAGERFDVLFRLLQLLGDEDTIFFIDALLKPRAGEAGPEAARIAGMADGSVPVPSVRYHHLRSVAASLDRALDGAPAAFGDAVVFSGRDSSPARRPSASGGGGWVLWLIERLMEGEAPEVMRRFREEIPERWREPVARAVAEIGSGSSGHRSLFRLAAGVLAAGGDGDELSGGEVAGFISRMLEELDRDEIPAFLRALLEMIPQAWRQDVALVLDAVAAASAGASDDARRRRLFSARIIVAGLRAAGHGALPELGGMGETMAGNDPELGRLLERLPTSVRALLQGTDGSSGGDAADIPDAPDLPERVFAASSSAPGGSVASPAGMPPHGAGGPVAGNDRSRKERSLPVAEPPAAWRDDAPYDPSSPVVVYHAGLVLLHPFIVPFLQDRGVTEPGGRSLAEHHIPRAAALLQFLATGRDEPYEFELGLCKVLLGRGLDTPLLLAGGLLGPEDAGEADALLRSVVEHWGALKNTSADALRESFLGRPGLLRREERRWRLQVEPAAFDLLLGHLPWGISIVRLPWMSEPIHVEWER